MKLKALVILPLAVALIGCGGDDPADALTEEQKADNAKLEKEAMEAPVTETVANPEVDAEPPAPGMSNDGTNPDLAGLDKGTTEDGDAKTLSIQEALQAAVENYDRMANAAVVEPNQKEWPELKTIEDLVKYRVIRAVPEAPAGKKWFLNPENMQVELK